MATLSIDYAKKLLLIRKAEGITQREFSEITGLSLSTIKNYEAGQKIAGIASVERVINTDKLKKYTMWILLDQVSPESGQIAPEQKEINTEKDTKKIM